MPQVSSTYFPAGEKVGLFVMHPGRGGDAVTEKTVPEDGMVVFDLPDAEVGEQRWISSDSASVRVVAKDGEATHPAGVLAETRPVESEAPVHTGARSTVTARGHRKSRKK